MFRRTMLALAVGTAFGVSMSAVYLPGTARADESGDAVVQPGTSASGTGADQSAIMMRDQAEGGTSGLGNQSGLPRSQTATDVRSDKTANDLRLQPGDSGVKYHGLGPQSDRHDLRSPETSDIAKDRQDIVKDHQDIARDRRLNRDGDSPDLRNDYADLHKDYADLHQDSADLQRDRQDVHADMTSRRGNRDELTHTQGDLRFARDHRDMSSTHDHVRVATGVDRDRFHSPRDDQHMGTRFGDRDGDDNGRFQEHRGHPHHHYYHRHHVEGRSHEFKK